VKTLEQIFWENVDCDSGECWEWLGSVYKNSNAYYGRISLYGKRICAHRLSYEIHKGTIGIGMVIDHTCKNTLCVNPSHLEQVTIGTNVLRGTGLSAENSRKTECKNGHPFDDVNTYTYTASSIKFGDRGCRACRRKECTNVSI
jgi:hypothetical protein